MGGWTPGKGSQSPMRINYIWATKKWATKKIYIYIIELINKIINSHRYTVEQRGALPNPLRVGASCGRVGA